MFATYFELGFNHILDLNGYDHILFVVALCAVYSIDEWKKILILITAFTLGHCLTLVLSGLQIVSVNKDLVEFLIPLTILITALHNVYGSARDTKKGTTTVYILALLFGLIHGLGFSNYFKALLGKDENIVSALLPFNLGVEAGQIVIVGIVMIATYIVTKVIKSDALTWSNLLSGIAAGVAISLMIG